MIVYQLQALIRIFLWLISVIMQRRGKNCLGNGLGNHAWAWLT